MSEENTSIESEENKSELEDETTDYVGSIEEQDEYSNPYANPTSYGAFFSDKNQIFRLIIKMMDALSQGDYQQLCQYLSHHAQHKIARLFPGLPSCPQALRYMLQGLFQEDGQQLQQLQQQLVFRYKGYILQNIKVRGNHARYNNLEFRRKHGHWLINSNPMTS